MSELLMMMKEKYKDFDISQQHLGRIMRNHNRTRKRTRHEHFPSERRKILTDKEKELDDFYNTVKQYPMDKIFSFDETSVGALLMPSYSRCYIGKRCVVKTNKNFVFQKFTLLVAINNSKRIGYEFYEKGGTTKERMVEFLEKYIFGKFKNHLIILDNARSHHNDLFKEAIIKSGNQYLFSIPYTPKTNAIEQYFNQLKYYLKKYRNVNNFQQLKENVKLSLDKIKPNNYHNYFNDAYGRKQGLEYSRKPSTRKCKPNLTTNCEGGVCEKFRVRQHPNKKKDDLRLIHGLLRCKSGCGLWNRDRNGSSNIYKIAEKAINKLERPSYLCRETSNQALKPSCYKQTLQGYEKTQP